ncbi:MAG: hypothetical protein WCI31_13080 [Prolixibacteraceae bacterium]
MDIYLKRFQLIVLVLALGSLSSFGNPRVLKGTIYRNGKPASGVLVTVHKSKATYYTSFDGKYTLKADSKSEWIKLTFNNQETKIAIDQNGSDYLDFEINSDQKIIVPSESGKTKP